MPVRITCPSCSATLSIKDEHATRAVKCPKCAGIIPPQPTPPATVSEPEALPTVPPPPEPRDEPEPPAKTKTGGKITGAPMSSKSRANRDEDEDDRPRKKRNEDEDDRPRKKRDEDEEDQPRKKRDEDERAEDDRPKRKPRDEDERAEDDRPRKKRNEDEDDQPRKPRTEDERAEDDRPKRKPRDEDDEDDRPRSKRRRDDDEDDRDEDRPRRRRRDEDEDEEDDRPVVTRRKPPAKSNAPVILAVVGFLLLSCCGVGGYGAYWVVNKAKDEAEKLGTLNTSVTKANYDKLARGTTTRAQAEEILGRGRPATSADLAKIFGTDKSTIASWQVPVDKNRALLWQNGEDYVLAMFHPNTDADARVQMKLWRPKSPPGASEGLSDDAAFVQKYPGKDDVSGPAVEATAEVIATAYQGGKAAADARYKDKVVLVEGVLDAIDIMPDGVMYARLVGTGSVGMPGNTQPRCVIQNVPAEMNKVFNLSKGQTVKFRGKCAGLSGPFVDVMNAKVESSGLDPAVTTTASLLLSLYGTNEGLADDRFKGKQLTVSGAVVESKTADAVYFTAKTSKSSLKIKVAIAGDYRKLYETLKPGDSRKLKGECGGKLEDEVFLNGAWIAP